MMLRLTDIQDWIISLGIAERHVFLHGSACIHDVKCSR